MRWKNYLQLIGVTLLIWIMFNVRWDLVIKVLTQLDQTYLIGYIFSFLAMVLVRTFRLRFALQKLGYIVNNVDCYIAIQEPSFMGAVTPGRLGEFARIGYIKEHGIPTQQAISIVIIERLADISILLAFSVAGIVYIFAPPTYHPIWGIILMIGLLFIFAIIHGYSFLLFRLKEPLNWILRWEPKFLTRPRKNLSHSFHFVMRQAAMPIFLLGLVCITLSFIQVYFLAKAFGFEVDYLVVMFAYTVATLASMLPISISGLGTREATYITIMGREGIVIEQALLFSLLDGVVFALLFLFVLVTPIWVGRIIKKTKH